MFLFFLLLFQNLRTHIPSGSLSNINFFDRQSFLRNSQTKIGNYTSAIRFDKNILWFQVTMCHGGFPLRSINLRVKIQQSIDDAETDVENLVMVQRMRSVQVVIKRAERMVVRDQPELSATRSAGHVATHITQNVVVSRRKQLGINFGFSNPSYFVAGKVYLHCYVLAVPNTTPDFASESSAATSSYALH